MGQSLAQFSTGHGIEVLCSHSFLIFPAKAARFVPGESLRLCNLSTGLACAPHIQLPGQNRCKLGPKPSSTSAPLLSLLLMFISQTEVFVYLICLGFLQFYSSAVKWERKTHQYWLSLWVWWGVEVMGVKCRRETFSSSDFTLFLLRKALGSSPKHVITPSFFVHLAGCIPGYLFAWMMEQLLKICRIFRTKRGKAHPEQQPGTVCRT